jgi:hypothetical protein
MKIIEIIEYDKEVTPQGNFCKVKALGETYQDEFGGEDKTVNAISEKIENGQRTFLICYTDGRDEEVSDINRVMRKLK